MSRFFHPRGALVVAGVLFVALTLFVLVTGVTWLDTAVRDWIFVMSSPLLIAALRVVNLAGSWWLLVPGMLALFLVFERARARWWVWTVLMIAAPLAEFTMKHAVGRARPENASFGFPSGHATASAAFFGAVLYLAEELPPARRRLVRTFAILMIVLVGLARILLRAHWPSDVLGGITLGLTLASAAATIAAFTPEASPELPLTAADR